MIKEILKNGKKIDQELKNHTLSLKDLSHEELAQRFCAREVEILCNKIKECFRETNSKLVQLIMSNDGIRDIVFDFMTDLDNYEFDIIQMLINTESL